MITHPGMTPEEACIRNEYESLMEELPIAVKEILMKSNEICGKENKKRAIDIFHGRHGINMGETEITLQELATKY